MPTVELLQPQDEAQYKEFVGAHPAGMLCYGLKWRDVLAQLTGATPLYSIIKHSGRIVGVMPAFLKSGPSGSVLNALPFYGCHGSPLVEEGCNDEAHLLLDMFDHLARENNCAASTFITNPFDRVMSRARNAYTATCRDERLGQITEVPPRADENTLFTLFEGRARTAIRKARKEGVEFRAEPSPGGLDRLRRLHEENMRRLNGIPKPQQFFELVEQIYDYETDYEILTATHEGREIAYLLLFYFNDKVEYFTPCVEEACRQYQPLSLLINEGMKRCSARGFRYWNFGGTWKSQEGVYKFKRSWGAQEHPYTYHVMIYDEHITVRTPEELLGEFPYFYVVPFEMLEQPC